MKKVLIIEDDMGIYELERDYLEIEGYEVDIQTNGVDGLAAALEHEYDLIILDIMIPKKDGFSVCRDIRKKKEIPIIMVSAKREDIDKIRGLGLGADDYMIKPFSPAELVARVKSHIQRYNRIRNSLGTTVEIESKIAAGSLEILLDSHQVFLGGTEVSLTPREYDILILLASSPNRVFTKEEVFESIWGIDSLGETSTIMVHINRLRAKIDKQFQGEEYIDTVWGVGYRFHKWDNYIKQ
ncbi:MAG: response regulator transcription factor [Veillonella dispar]|jgi:response regulator (cheY-like domain, HTH domain)|uniref:DNA-binding response regulator n=1 Tax=Veillonella orientalis TaxID=2682455 RepID=A0ABM7HFN4_9FIRM|nr:MULTISPECIES: response regulator transcription factor [Veillonella]ETJ12107.1 MAG: Response regulator receiver protein [Veillonella sp. DORA_A_3_16_22]KXB87544.1 putative transcriptional regulatory protein ResD [Veillonella dispar]MBF1741952.1 response regulator transcription factor [Veillonella dispar]MBS4966791.1 response regulator transcription factor [Veillonella sp.]MBS5189098.1 response regulator transcription factor [Veillonella sp.]